jgi:hypothetical protein
VRLIDVDGVVAIGKASSAAVPVKDLPPERSAGDLKIDRQARLLLADFAGEFEAIIVFDVGDQQVSVHQCGPFARDLFDVCLDFWARCPSLTWSALNHECVNFLRPSCARSSRIHWGVRPDRADLVDLLASDRVSPDDGSVAAR